MTTDNRIESKDSFERTIQTDAPVAVEFSAGWCPDCRRLDMFIDDVLNRFDSVPFHKIDTEQLPDITSEQEVMGIPSILVFQNGEKIGHLHSADAKTPGQVGDFFSKYY
ncbi:thioredoxin family protein [Marinococcus halotolerans]|uniref:thioredoxin family protein n=1 Tax=Marinococcus halotolerans TaxID=301092 RepID=UPI0003B6A565|nr:thioredoxin family protein [Marinococcus halotolerans]